jgi:ribulose 1,5-bisphosphate synthetase/thiazole synthase
MRKIKVLMLPLFVYLGIFNASAEQIKPVDICVYGGSSAGIVAAYTAKKMGKSVVIIEPGKYLGGLTTGGLGATDIGNKFAITGLARDFYRRLGTYYGKFEQWVFEPHVADKVYIDMIKEAKLNIVKNHRLIGVKKQNGNISEITVEVSDHPQQSTNKTVRAKMFIDCTYEGDLMAKSGVSYTYGREANSVYGETYNGIQMSDFHQIPNGIDPYVVPGKPESGLLYGIGKGTLAPAGTGDKLIQAYNFRLCLTQDKNNQIPFSRPENYNPSKYTLLTRIIEKEGWNGVNGEFASTKRNGLTEINNKGNFLIKDMPNGKTDFNNFGGFSTDMIGGNYEYPEADYNKRKEIWKAHEVYTKGLLYFMSHDISVPEAVRKDMLTWGYTKDEFKDLGGFSNQLYVREARRMVSDVVMTQKHCEGLEVVADAIGMAAYGMDSHNCQRIVVNGMVKNEGDVQKKVPNAFPISYRSIVPKQSECTNLLVPVCLSASHIAFGSIRMEPVFMVMGQSAATAAVLAIDKGVAVQKVAIKDIQRLLTEDPLVNGKTVEILVDNDHEKNVEIKGDWNEVKGGYGKNMLISNGKSTVENTVKFKPEIKKSGKYQVYAYFPKNEKRADVTSYNVFNGVKNKTVNIKTADIKELGLSAGEWIDLGTYQLSEGSNAFVEISAGSNGIVTADAIILNKK